MPISPTQSDMVRQQADDFLQVHGTAGSSAEVDALNGILNNINVQTKNQNYMTSNNQPQPRKLPPLN